MCDCVRVCVCVECDLCILSLFNVELGKSQYSVWDFKCGYKLFHV